MVRKGLLGVWPNETDTRATDIPNSKFLIIPTSKQCEN